jgi:predicted DsbA family dithiol-disulfide isomerase
MRVWVDLTNSPHVLVMRPLIERMRAAGHEVHITARDFAQTLQLLERYRMDHTAIGHHRGGKLTGKGLGLVQRSLALTRWARKRRFDAALDGFPQRDEVEVVWRSFELDPQAPRVREGDHTDHVASKYGVPREQAAARHDQMTEMAKAEGLELRFDRVRGGNTFDAHRIVHLGAAHGRQGETIERLKRGYFTEGEALGDPEVLARLAVHAGLPEDEVRDTLAGDRFADDVRADEQSAAQLGITAVPMFVVDREVAMSGAQQPELLRALLGRGLRAPG